MSAIVIASCVCLIIGWLFGVLTERARHHLNDLSVRAGEPRNRHERRAAAKPIIRAPIDISLPQRRPQASARHC